MIDSVPSWRVVYVDLSEMCMGNQCGCDYRDTLEVLGVLCLSV